MGTYMVLVGISIDCCSLGIISVCSAAKSLSMFRFVLASILLFYVFNAQAQFLEENLLGKWQSRVVMSPDGDSSLSFYRKEALMQEMIKEELDYMIQTYGEYKAEDSINIAQQVSNMLMMIFETTYYFRRGDELVLYSWKNRDPEQPVSLVGQFSLNTETGKLRLSINNDPTTMTLLSLERNQMVARDEAGNIVTFVRVE